MHSSSSNTAIECRSSSSEKLNKLLLAAFQAASEGYSPDRVVADPIINSKFLRICKIEQSSLSSKDANKRLLNARKAGLLKGIKSRKRTTFKDEDEYRYAAEIAVRFLEKRDNMSLDDIICDPVLVGKFDAIASRICPGYTSLQYRWAALNLRKSSKLKPELMSHVLRPVGMKLGPISDLVLSELPPEQGLYVFYGKQETLYVGEAGNLRLRVEKHLDHSDNKNLARWFWENGFADANLEIQLLEKDTKKKVRRALEAELIRSRHPLFNVQRP